MIEHVNNCAFAELERREKEGQLVKLAHCCNAIGAMRSGIAKTVKDRFPEAFKAYRDSGFKLGTISTSNNIINMVAQANYGYDGQRYVNYGAFSSCLTKISIYLSIWKLKFDKEKKPVIIVPYLIACDRAGGDWEVIEELLEWNLDDCDVVVCHRD